ncbi:hypothetical protein AMTR_s00055p00210530 [Amborella trichopoda]|uniref:Uncharacterized protein n=1 Tax=Amborella trichopoda TaxID=13333 RepID=U5CYE1_AMBTC|nr:hypothetical protein AMTR_s00055p00210530 [Amborella trichopoda]
MDVRCASLLIVMAVAKGLANYNPLEEMESPHEDGPSRSTFSKELGTRHENMATKNIEAPRMSFSGHSIAQRQSSSKRLPTKSGPT